MTLFYKPIMKAGSILEVGFDIGVKLRKPDEISKYLIFSSPLKFSTFLSIIKPSKTMTLHVAGSIDGSRTMKGKRFI